MKDSWQNCSVSLLIQIWPAQRYLVSLRTKAPPIRRAKLRRLGRFLFRRVVSAKKQFVPLVGSDGGVNSQRQGRMLHWLSVYLVWVVRGAQLIGGVVSPLAGREDKTLSSEAVHGKGIKIDQKKKRRKKGGSAVSLLRVTSQIPFSILTIRTK